MSFNIDIYGLTKYRDKKTIDAFIDQYIDLEKSEDREDEELMILMLEAAANPDRKPEYEWEPAGTLTRIVQRGLDYPRRSFTVYSESKRPDIDSAILSFTTDNQLVLGLSINDEGESPENEIKAEKLLMELAVQFQCHLGMFCVEEPPPQYEEAFKAMESYKHVRFFRKVRWNDYENKY